MPEVNIGNGMSHLSRYFLLNYKGVLVTYSLLFFGLFSPFLLPGEVTAPHRQTIEIGATDSSIGGKHIENRMFGDYTNSYIPEISQNLKGAHTGWLTLWTNQNELGRPLYHISGFSVAYPPSLILAGFTDNPWRFITALSLLTCFAAGIFVILYCKEIGIHPVAGLIAGGSLAASPLFMMWLTFPMFSAVWCWSAAILWAVTRLARKMYLLGWSILAFSSYSMLMTAYPQPVVFHAYILAAYGLYLAYRRRQFGRIETGRFLVLTTSALITAVVLALPVYLDLAHIAAESERMAQSPSFFTMFLPTLANLEEVIRFVVLSTVPELFGNPVETTYPLPYDGLSITPLMLFLAVIGLFAAFRQTWGWWLAIAIFVSFTFSHALYEVGVIYLGFNLSPVTPFGSIMLPLTVITAYGADRLVNCSLFERRSQVLFGATGVVMAVIAIGLGFGLSQGAPIRWGMLLTMLFMVTLLSAQHKKTRPVLLVATLIMVMATISFPLMLRQDLASIATTSPLVEKTRAALPAGARFAIVEPGLPVVPPHFNAELGIASVHSSNSLSSRRYTTLINALGGEVGTYGRRNFVISPDYNSTMFWMSNIGLILSPVKLSHENLEYLGEESGVHLHKVISRMGDSLQFSGVAPIDSDIDNLQMGDPRLLPRLASLKQVDQGDSLEFEVSPGPPSVLVLSQKYHRDWQAQVFGPLGWVPAKTTVINGVFQGVLLSENTQRVRLEFKPYVRYAWIAHAFWLLLFATLGFKAWQNKRNAAREGVTTR